MWLMWRCVTNMEECDYHFVIDKTCGLLFLDFILDIKVRTRLGLIRSSPRYGLSTPYRLTIRNSASPFFLIHLWEHFQHYTFSIKIQKKDKTSKTDDVLTEHGGLLHVLPLAVHLRFFLLDKVGGPWDFSVSPRPLGFGFGALGLWGMGLTTVTLAI